MSPIEKLKQLGLKPAIIPLPVCSVATGLSQQSLKKIARDQPELLQIIRMSERRCGIRQDVLERFIETRNSAAAAPGLPVRRALGNKAKRGGVAANV